MEHENGKPPPAELQVEFIHDRDCPHAAEARARLVRAFTTAGIAPRWVEWDRGDPDAPAHVKRWGSPTILVNGRDAAEGAPADNGACCRVYRDEGGELRGVPSVSTIAAALRAQGAPSAAQGASLSGRRKGWVLFLAAIPGLAAGLLPRLA